MLVEKIIQRRLAELRVERLGTAIRLRAEGGDRFIEEPPHSGTLAALTGKDIGAPACGGGGSAANQRWVFAPVDNRLQGADQLVAVGHHGQSPVFARDPRAKQHVGNGLGGYLRMTRGIGEHGSGLALQQVCNVRRQ